MKLKKNMKKKELEKEKSLFFNYLIIIFRD